MQIQKRTMNWLPKTSLYHESTARRARLKSQSQTFLANQSNLAGTIGNIMTNNMTETTNIVSRIAMQRLGIKKTA